MAHLATLSSNTVHYKDAIRSLIALYIAHGYPKALVRHWSRSGFQEQWDNRLTEKSKGEEPNVLVLKTEYNLAWNYFNAQKLGDQIFGYWQEWLNRLDSGKFDIEYPLPLDEDYGNLKGSPNLFGERLDGTLVFGYNVWNTDIMNRQVITSCKRTVNLANMTNL